MLTKPSCASKIRQRNPEKSYAEFVSEYDKLEFAVSRFPRDVGVPYSSCVAATGPIGYSDSAGKPKKCHCKPLSLLPMIFRIRRSFLGPKTVTVAAFSL